MTRGPFVVVALAGTLVALAVLGGFALDRTVFHFYTDNEPEKGGEAREEIEAPALTENEVIRIAESYVAAEQPERPQAAKNFDCFVAGYMGDNHIDAHNWRVLCAYYRNENDMRAGSFVIQHLLVVVADDTGRVVRHSVP